MPSALVEPETPGSRPRRRSSAEASLDRWCREFGDELIERLVTDAKQGKGYAMRLVLDRILPVKKEIEVSRSRGRDRFLCAHSLGCSRD